MSKSFLKGHKGLFVRQMDEQRTGAWRPWSEATLEDKQDLVKHFENNQSLYNESLQPWGLQLDTSTGTITDTSTNEVIRQGKIKKQTSKK